DAGMDLDEPGGTEVSPGELFFARPRDLHRLANGLGQPRGFHRCRDSVLAAVTGAHVRDNDADLVDREPQRPRQLGSAAARHFRPGPDGELAVDPLGDGYTWLERRMRDVRDRVRRLDRLVGRLQTGFHRALSAPAAPAEASAAEASLPTAAF